MNSINLMKRASPIAIACMLVACGGGGGGGSDSGTTNPPTTPNQGFVIGGSLTGLGASKTLVLQNNGGDDLRMQANGTFTFNKVVAQGGDYVVSIASQPAGQTCKLSNGSGKAAADVSNVSVACADTPVDPGPGTDTGPGTGGSATSEACMDNENYRKIGSSWTITTGANFQKSTITALTTYRGHSAYRQHNVTSAGVEADAYSNLVDNVTYSYGAVMTLPALHETYFSPGMAVPLSLPLNQTHTQVLNSVTVQPGGADIGEVATYTYTYRGRETVTTPVGTFETCKIDLSVQSAVTPLTSWTHWYVASGKLKGFVVQSNWSDGLSRPSKIEVSWN